MLGGDVREVVVVVVVVVVEVVVVVVVADVVVKVVVVDVVLLIQDVAHWDAFMYRALVAGSAGALAAMHAVPAHQPAWYMAVNVPYACQHVTLAAHAAMALAQGPAGSVHVLGLGAGKATWPQISPAG